MKTLTCAALIAGLSTSVQAEEPDYLSVLKADVRGGPAWEALNPSHSGDSGPRWAGRGRPPWAGQGKPPWAPRPPPWKDPVPSVPLPTSVLLLLSASGMMAYLAYRKDKT